MIRVQLPQHLRTLASVDYEVVVDVRGKAEPAGSGDFTPLWSGQAMRLGREMPAAELTRTLVEEAQARLRQLSSS